MYTWQILSLSINPSRQDFILKYRLLDDNNVPQPIITEAHVTSLPSENIKQACIRICENAIGAFNDKAKQKDDNIKEVNLSSVIGLRDDIIPVVQAEVDAAKVIIPPSQSDLDKREFITLIRTYKITVIKETFKIAVDIPSSTLATQIQATYKPEYDNFLT